MNIRMDEISIHASGWIDDVSKEVAIRTEKEFVNWIIDHRKDKILYTIESREFGHDDWRIYVQVSYFTSSYPDMYIRAKEANKKVMEIISTIEDFIKGSN